MSSHSSAPGSDGGVHAGSARESQAPAAFAALGYAVSRVLGRGGFGTVYAAQRTRDGAPVAIKLALGERPDADESLMREAVALRTVGPPTVPSVYDFGKVLERFYMVLEYVGLPTLADRIVEHGGPMPLDLFSELARGLLDALDAIHARGIVHRDLKPENIFIAPDGTARIIDFGLAREHQSRNEIIDATTMDDVGTAEYMSPEQCDGLAEADPRSDIYSLGVLFYELLSGAPPFWGQAADVREAHRSRRPMPLSLKFPCSPELDQLIRRCLAKDRTRRFDNVAQLRTELDAILNSTAAAGPIGSAGALRSRRPSDHKQPTAAREKRTVGLVFFDSRSGLGSVQSVVTAAGGQIVQTNGSQYVAAFGHDVGDNPARVALVAAHRLSAARLAPRLLVDVASVSVQNRPDGSRRIFSPVFTKKDRFPSDADPPGVQLTAAANEVMPDLIATKVEGKGDRYVLPIQQFANETTTFGVQLSPLVGRDAIVQTLFDTARTALTSDVPALITVLAEPGYGRSHLATVAAERIERGLLPAVEVIRLTAQEGLMRTASQALPELLRRVLDLPRTTPPQDGKPLLLEKLGEAAEGSWAAAAHALGWIDAEHPEVRRLAAAPGALRLASARAAGEALRRRAKQRPVALLLDDAHLADEPTLDALEYVTMKDAPAPLWVCVLARASFSTSRPTWGTRAAHAHKLVLPALEQADAVALARRLLLPAEYIPEAVLVRLAARTQGVPRLLVELARGLKRDGFVRRAERGTGYYLAIEELDKLPDLPIVQWNAIREVEALPPQLAGHARLASVLGANFSAGEVEALLAILERDEIPEDMQLDADVGIQRLVDAGILVRHRSGLCDFRHSLLRETIYQQVPDAQRTRLHRAAFEAYRGLPMQDNERLPRLALHAARSGEREVAAGAYLEIAQRYTRVQKYLEAEAAFGSALDNLADTDDRTITAARGRGLMRSRLGRQEDALNDLRRARERAHARGDRPCEIELMLDEATVLDWTRDMNQSAALVRGVQALDEPLSPLLRARLTMSLARSHHRQGETE
ncbi:MAG: protein kinase, partial [Polyangiales bacterium]